VASRFYPSAHSLSSLSLSEAQVLKCAALSSGLLFYVYETWSLALRHKRAEGVWNQGTEEDILAKTNKVTGNCKNLHNEELHGLHSCQILEWSNQRERDRWNKWHIFLEKRNGCRILVEKTEWKNYFKGISVDEGSQEIGWEGLECINLAWNGDYCHKGNAFLFHKYGEFLH
jgi:hypothetical protein